MGISTNVYVVYGVRIGYDDNLGDDFDEVYEKAGSLGVDIIIDGMGGDYMVLGSQLYCSGDARYGEMDNSDEIDISRLEENKSRYIAGFKSILPEHAHLLDAEWKLIAFVHYS